MVDSVGENVPKYKIPRPRKCFRCRGTCYAYKIKKTRRRGFTTASGSATAAGIPSRQRSRRTPSS